MLISGKLGLGPESIWEFFGLSASFFYKLKTAQKVKSANFFFKAWIKIFFKVKQKACHKSNDPDKISDYKDTPVSYDISR